MIKLNDLISFIKKNYLLGILYPLVIFVNLIFLKEFKANNLLFLFIIISLTNQFDLGLIKNSFFNHEKYRIKSVFILLFIGMIILSFISFGILELFQMEFRKEYLFVIFVGLVANEFKSHHDSQSNYFLGFLIKNCLNLCVVFIFLSFQITATFFPLVIISFIALTVFILTYKKLDLVEKQQLVLSDFKFFTLNIFTFISGNVDRFLVIPFIGQPLRNNYLYYSETNAKLNGLFGFLNNLFLYKQLQLSRMILLLVTFIIIVVLTAVALFFNMDYSYYIFSSSLIVSVYSQYYIFSKIGDLKGIASSLFPFIGLLIYLLFFYSLISFFEVNLFMLTLAIIIKSLSEMIFIKLMIKKQPKLL